MTLFRITMQEKDSNATRTRYVLARNATQASNKAKKKNPDNLWKPSVTMIEVLGKPVQ